MAQEAKLKAQFGDEEFASGFKPAGTDTRGMSAEEAKMAIAEWAAGGDGVVGLGSKGGQ